MIIIRSQQKIPPRISIFNIKLYIFAPFLFRGAYFIFVLYLNNSICILHNVIEQQIDFRAIAFNIFPMPIDWHFSFCMGERFTRLWHTDAARAAAAD